MTQQGLSAGFVSLSNLQQRDEQGIRNIYGCIQWNSGLLNALVVRSTNIVAATALTFS